MKKYTVVLLLSTFMLFASGCISMTVNTIVNPDGSGQWELGIYIDESFMEGLGEFSDGDTSFDLTDGVFGEDMSETISDEESGITFSAETRLLNDTEQWFFIVANVPNVEAWAHLKTATENIDALSVDDALGGGMSFEDPVEEETDESDEMFAYPIVTLDGDSVRVELSGPAPADTLDLGDDSEEADMFSMGFFDMSSIFRLSYSIQLPEVTDTNGELDATTNTATWQVDWSSTEPLEIYAEGLLK